MSIEKWKGELLSRCLSSWTEGDEAWLLARAGQMTGSKAGAALGFSSFSSPMDVYNEWVDPDYKQERSAADRLRMEIGTLAEDAIRKAGAIHSERPGHYESFECDVRLVGHPEFDWASCSPDGFAWSAKLGRVVLEVKNTNIGMKHAYETEDGMPCCPPNYRTQCVWNMACTGADCAVLVVSFNGDLLFRLIERDQEEIDFLFGEAKRFVDACVDEDPLSIFAVIQDGNMRWESVKDLYRRATDEGISVVDEEFDTLLTSYLEATKQWKEATERHKWLKSMVAEKVGGHRRIETTRYKVSWPQNKGKMSFSADLFHRKNPTIKLEDYHTRGKPYRMRMTITPLKKENK